MDEDKHLGCQSDEIKCSRQDLTWGPLDCESKTLPLDQQVKHFTVSKLEVLILCPEICHVIERFFIFCEFFWNLKSKLFKISQSPVRFDFFPVKYGPVLSYVINPRVVRIGALCKTIASKVAFYIGKLTNPWQSMLNLSAKLSFSLRFIVQKGIV